MRIGRKGISGESKAAIGIFIIFSVLFVVTYIMSYFAQVGGPPTAPSDVIKYYDDLLKGEYQGKKATPTALVVAFFVPLLSTFAILWALIRLLPVFKSPGNRPAAVVLAMGLSIYIVPTMAWAVMQVFPPILGVSAIFIGIAIFAMALFIMIATFFEFGGLRWGGVMPGAETPAERVREKIEEEKAKAELEKLKAGKIRIDSSIIHGLEEIKKRLGDMAK
jgi:hypothetical protein